MPPVNIDTMPRPRLATAVTRALANAKENGFDMEHFSDVEWRDDLISYDADLAGEDENDILQAVIYVRAKNGK